MSGTDPHHKTISKFLSLLLRHQPHTIDLTLDPHGWASIDELIAKSRQHSQPLTRRLIKDIVASSDKQRFALSDCGGFIRANQGHSLDVALGLAPQTPPQILFHGTATRFYTSILQTGLSNQGRQHVHLSSDPETAYAVGRRHGKPLIFKVLSLVMHRAGHRFYRSRNGVWLTTTVPPQYLHKENLTS